MAASSNGDLLGEPIVDRAPISSLDKDLFMPGYAPPGKTVDLSGGSSSYSSPTGSAGSYGPGPSARSQTSFNSSNYNGGGVSSNGSSGGGPRGPTSIEGGGGGISLSGLTPANIIRQLSTRPVSELIMENSRQFVNLPRYAARAYSAAARRYLRPWNEFFRLRPANIIEGFRSASRRGEIQVHIQNNVLANARAFCPNYAFVFLAMLFMFVCTSPGLLCMLGAVGGGWSHAMRSDGFRNRPWTLQIGSIQVPLGANLKMLIMSLPTLLFLHFFMGPVLWSAALCSGGVSVAHAALRDRDDDRDHGDDDHGVGPGGNIRIRDMA